MIVKYSFLLKKKLGPNVYICKGVKVGPGVRISNSIILGGTEIYV